mgnify:FL=1
MEWLPILSHLSHWCIYQTAWLVWVWGDERGLWVPLWMDSCRPIVSEDGCEVSDQSLYPDTVGLTSSDGEEVKLIARLITVLKIKIKTDIKLITALRIKKCDVYNIYVNKIKKQNQNKMDNS